MDDFGNTVDNGMYWEQYIGSMLWPYGFYVEWFWPSLDME